MAISKKREKEILAEEKFRLEARKQVLDEEKKKKEQQEREKEEQYRKLWTQEKEKAEKRNAENEALILRNHWQMKKIPDTFTLDMVSEIFGFEKTINPSLYAFEEHETYASRRKSIFKIIIKATGFAFLLSIIAIFITGIMNMYLNIHLISTERDYISIAFALAGFTLSVLFQIRSMTDERIKHDYERDKNKSSAKNDDLYKKVTKINDDIMHLDAEIIGTIVAKHISTIINKKGIRYTHSVDAATGKIVVEYSFLGIGAIPKTIMQINDYPVEHKALQKEPKVIAREYGEYMCKVPLLIANAFFCASPSIQHVVCNGYIADDVKFPSGACVLSVDFDRPAWKTYVGEELPRDVNVLDALLQRFPFIHDTAGVTPFS